MIPDLLLAEAFARERHAGQLRDGTNAPYVTHPIAVAAILRAHGVTDRVTLAAALLHDVVEDTPTPLAEIEARFGAEVAGGVGELTRPPAKPDQTKEDWRRDLLAHLPHVSERARQIKLADRLHNLGESRVAGPDDKYQRYRRWTAEVLQTIPQSVLPSLWRQLAAYVDEP